MHKYLSISAAALTALLLASGGAAVAAAAEPGDSVDDGFDENGHPRHTSQRAKRPQSAQ